MSGVKNTTVSISSTELNRLRSQANRTSNLESQNAILNRQNTALIQANADLERRVGVVEAHNRNNQQTIANFRTEVRRAVEQATQRSEAAVRAAKEEARRAQQQISRAAAENARAIEETNRRVTESLRQTENRLGQQIQQQSSRIDQLNQSVDQINAGNATLSQMADELCEAAQTIARNARDFSHGVELIGGMKPVQDSLDRAQESIDLTRKQPVNASAARQAAADAFAQAQDFYQRAAAAEEMWSLHELAARQSIAAATARIESTRTLNIEEEGEDGKPVRVALDVDHWSDGALTALTGRVSALEAQLNNAHSLEDLDGVRAAADRVSTEAVDAAASANIAAHESQNRSETAADFADSLTDHGMELVGHGFDGGDKRGVHRIHMRDAVTLDEVIITQTPIRNADGSITTRVEADLISDTLNAATFQRRGQDMYATLGLSADDNHTQTEVQTQPGYEHRPSDRGVALPAQRSGEKLPARSDSQSAAAN